MAFALLHKLTKELEQSSSDNWQEVNDRIQLSLRTLETAVRHVNDLNNLSKANRELEIKNLVLRHALLPDDDEKGAFPVQRLPFRQNTKFYGRQLELEKVSECLKPTGQGTLRTHTIYGRRGVGKTQIALQFVYTNSHTYDALFWIQCDTSVTIRRSFGEIAVALNIPAADRSGRDEDNLVAVQKWLKKTSKQPIFFREGEPVY